MSMVEIILQIGALVASFYAVRITTKVFAAKEQASIGREQIEKVYHDLFRLLEPVLYANLSLEACNVLVDKAYKLCNSHRILVNPDIFLWIKKYNTYRDVPLKDYSSFKYNYFSTQSSQKLNYLYCFYRLCALVDKEYDRACKNAFFPVRSIAYRLANRQYSTLLKGFLYVLYLDRYLLLATALLYIGLCFALNSFGSFQA